MNDGLKLYLVEGKSSSSLVSRVFNYGDDYGETYAFSDFVVATNHNEAIQKVWEKRQKEVEDHKRKREKVSAEVRALEDQGDTFEANKVINRAAGHTGLGLMPPSIPQDKEKWRATEVEVKGYKITLEPLEVK